MTSPSCAFSVFTGLIRFRCTPRVARNLRYRVVPSTRRWTCSSTGTISLATKQPEAPLSTVSEGDSSMFHPEATFFSLGMSPEICEKLQSVGITTPTTVQAAVIPRLLAGLEIQHEYARRMRKAREDYVMKPDSETELPTLLDEDFEAPMPNEDPDDVLVVGAETGSGKTLAYLLPFIEALKRDPDCTTKAVVLLPTRELCAQTASFLATHIPDAPRTLVLSGGQPPDVSDLPGVRIFVATPASLCMHMRFSEDGLRNDKYIVVDEADMLLTGSFLKEVDNVLNQASMKPFAVRKNKRVRQHNRNRLVFVGATYPHWVGERVKSVVTWIRKRYPEVRDITTMDIHRRSTRLQSTWTQVKDESERQEALEEILRNASDGEKIMIFVESALRVQYLYGVIGDKYGVTRQLHKKMIPVDRAESLRKFAADEANILICTDVASRGLDLGRVTRVIEYDFSSNVVAHLHRIGRTARAGAYGRTDSIYDKVSKPLADAIRGRDERDENVVDGVFSRNRSFRRKLKKILREGEIKGQIGEE